MTPGTRFLTKGILDMLRDRTGRPGEHNEVPADHGETWWILRYIDATFSGPPLTNPEEDGEMTYQIDACAQGRSDQAEWMADRIRVAVLGRYPDGAFKSAIVAPTGYEVSDRRPGMAGSLDRQGNSPDFVWTIPNRYVFVITPGGVQ